MPGNTRFAMCQHSAALMSHRLPQSMTPLSHLLHHALSAPLRRVAAAAAMLLAVAPPAQAIVSTSDPANWLGSSVSALSGVAKLVINGSTGCSGSLLAGGAYVLTAAHCVTDGSGVLSANSIALSFQGGTVSAQVSSSAQISVFSGWTGSAGSSSDLALLKLDSAVTAISGYELYDGNPLHQTILIAGYGLTGTGTTGSQSGTWGTLHWGENVYDAVNGSGGAYLYDFDNGQRRTSALGDTGLGSLEASIASGDSGGASFIEVGGTLYLVGVHSFGSRTGTDIDSTVNSSYGEIAGDSVLTGATTQLWLNQVSTVPEPATLAQMLVGLLAVAGATKRRRPGGLQSAA